MQTLRTGICNSRNGFTLLELILVIFIISVSVAIVFPSISFFEGSKIKSDAKKIASIIRYLNENAITSKEIATLKIDLKKKLLSYNSTEGNREEKFETIQSVETQSKGIISEGELIIFFHQLGALENINIYLSNVKSNYLVSFNYLSGRIKIIEQ